MPDEIKVLTLNLHKGFSSFNRKFVLHELREAIRAESADLVFLQEVIGNHEVHAGRHKDWPEEPQYEFLADSIWQDYAYGKNAVYTEGHHGNAVLSKWPIKFWTNFDISQHRSERRGVLHCEIDFGTTSLHALCVHFGLLERFRQNQLQTLKKYVLDKKLNSFPTIIAGDFNDWRNRAKNILTEEMGFVEAAEYLQGQPLKTFPSFFPIFRLDRVYSINLSLKTCSCPDDSIWAKLSDHRPMSVEFKYAQSP